MLAYDVKTVSPWYNLVVKENNLHYKKKWKVASPKQRIDHDRLYKELFQTFFADFVQLFFPGAYQTKC